MTSDRAARSHIMIRFCQDSRQGRLSGGPRRLPIGSRPFWRGCGRGSGAWGCGSVAVTERPERTAKGYRWFRCRECGRQFNERGACLLNRTQYPSDVIALVVLWRLRYKLSLRDLADMFLIRGIVFSHEAVRDWEAKLALAMAEELRRLATSAAAGTWTRGMSKSMATGAICAGPSTATARWWTRSSASPAIWPPPKHSFGLPEP